jgi:hypothetical protein
VWVCACACMQTPFSYILIVGSLLCVLICCLLLVSFSVFTNAVSGSGKWVPCDVNVNVNWNQDTYLVCVCVCVYIYIFLIYIINC